MQVLNLGNLSSRQITQSALNTYQMGWFGWFFTLFLLLSLISFGAFFSGYYLGKYLSLPESVKEGAASHKNAVKQNGRLVLIEETYNFSLNYPETWNLTKKSSGLPGAYLSTDSASVDIWYGVEVPVILNETNLSAVETTEISLLTIAGLQKPLTTYRYKAGNYFSVLNLPATDKTASLTFWVKAKNLKYHEEAIGIINSLKFN